jgi:hypothetical protein
MVLITAEEIFIVEQYFLSCGIGRAGESKACHQLHYVFRNAFTKTRRHSNLVNISVVEHF